MKYTNTRDAAKMTHDDGLPLQQHTLICHHAAHNHVYTDCTTTYMYIV